MWNGLLKSIEKSVCKYLSRPFCDHKYRFDGNHEEYSFNGAYIDGTQYSKQKCKKCGKEKVYLIKHF